MSSQFGSNTLQASSRAVSKHPQQRHLHPTRPSPRSAPEGDPRATAATALCCSESHWPLGGHWVCFQPWTGEQSLQQNSSAWREETNKVRKRGIWASRAPSAPAQAAVPPGPIWRGDTSFQIQSSVCPYATRGSVSLLWDSKSLHHLLSVPTLTPWRAGLFCPGPWTWRQQRTGGKNWLLSGCPG